jgi:CBS domain-containing protein
MATEASRERDPRRTERPLQARDVMTRGVVSVAPETTLRAVAELMRDRQIGAVPVVDVVGRVLGLATDRDVVVRAVAVQRDIDHVSVGEVMSIGIECAAPEASVSALAEKMARYRVRRIPIVDEERRLVGIVSRDDLF